MGTTIQFDLNRAIQQWLRQLGQSPQVKAENLMELESHVRDSVVQLQMKGLTSEESFLVATRRAGTPAQLEPEFAKVNRNPLNVIIHGLILVFFCIGCWLLWALLHFPQMMMRAMIQATKGMPLPAFTQFVVGCQSYLVLPPLLAAIYCLYVWMRKTGTINSWMGFFAVTMAVLFLLTLPTLVAILLPIIDFINHAAAK